MTTRDDPVDPTAHEAVEAELLKVASLHNIHGIACLCGFKSLVSRDRTKHIMDAALAIAAPHIKAQSLDKAADDAEGLGMEEIPVHSLRFRAECYRHMGGKA